MRYDDIKQYVNKNNYDDSQFVWIPSSNDEEYIAYVLVDKKIIDYPNGFNDVLKNKSKSPIIFKDCKFSEIIIKDREISNEIVFEDCYFDDSCNISNNKLNNISFFNCCFRGSFYFKNNTISKKLTMYDIIANSGNPNSLLEFEHNQYNSAGFYNCKFETLISFSNTYFKNTIFNNITFVNSFLFDKCVFDKNCDFIKINCGNSIENYRFRENIKDLINATKDYSDFQEYLRTQLNNDKKINKSLFEIDLTKVELAAEEIADKNIDEQNELIEQKIAKDDSKYRGYYVSLSEVANYLGMTSSNLQQRLKHCGITSVSQKGGYAINDIRRYIKKNLNIVKISSEKAIEFAISAEKIRDSIVSLDDNLLEKLELMRKFRYSNMPVIEKGKIIGVLNAAVIIHYLTQHPQVDLTNVKIRDIGTDVLDDFRKKTVKFVKSDSTYADIQECFKTNNKAKWIEAIFITDNGKSTGKLEGIITSNDFSAI